VLGLESELFSTSKAAAVELSTPPLIATAIVVMARKMETGNSKIEIRNSKMETGKWKLENRKWKLETES
jgi:hypothetical protein